MNLPLLPSPFWALVPLGVAALALLARRGRRRALQSLAQAQAELLRQRRAHEQALAQARVAAEQADLAKTRFLAAASHDLRQPAHALGLYLATLRAGELAPAQAELAGRMADALAALQGLYVALLDVSRIDAGSLVPQWTLVSLAPLLRRLADEQAAAAEARGLRLSLHLADESATSVTDPVLLERLLRNLLCNAVQHTARGGLLLACRRRTAGDGGLRLRVEVWDSGVGIAAADQERVFQEFEQLPGSRGGLGLGLPIARRLAQLLQLRLTLHSRPGRGSVFFIDGLAPAGPAPLRAAAARQDQQRLAGARVVVLDDDADVRQATRGLLQRWGCEVLVGADDAEVLRQPGAGNAPQALIADLHLADGRSGIDAVQALFTAWGRRVPLLLASGTAQATAPAGLAAAFLAKPVSPARLRAWLEEALAEPVRGVRA